MPDDSVARGSAGSTSTEAPAVPGFLAQARQKTAFWMFLCLLLLVGAFGFLSPQHVFFNRDRRSHLCHKCSIASR